MSLSQSATSHEGSPCCHCGVFMHLPSDGCKYPGNHPKALPSAVQALERCGQCGGLHLPGAPCVVGDDDRVVASSIAASGDERVDDMRHALELDQQAHLEQKLDAIANALGYPVESWRMAGCDVLAHAITDLIGNYRRLESQIAKIDVTLDQLGAPKAAPFAGSEFNVALSRRGRIKRLVQSANASTDPYEPVRFAQACRQSVLDQVAIVIKEQFVEHGFTPEMRGRLINCITSVVKAMT